MGIGAVFVFGCFLTPFSFGLLNGITYLFPDFFFFFMTLSVLTVGGVNCIESRFCCLQPPLLIVYCHDDLLLFLNVSCSALSDGPMLKVYLLVVLSFPSFFFSREEHGSMVSPPPDASNSRMGLRWPATMLKRPVLTFF